MKLYYLCFDTCCTVSVVNPVYATVTLMVGSHGTIKTVQLTFEFVAFEMVASKMGMKSVTICS